MLQVNRVLAGLCIGFGLGLAALTIACSGSGGGGGSNLPAVQAPSGLTYSANPAVYTKGIAIPANTPASSGGAVTSYAVTPALPAGLALNTTSGVISGTPVALATSATYAVTATNGGGSATVALNLTVNDAAPAGLTYGAATATYTKGVPIAPNMPSNTGGAIVAYAIAPALSSGLALNPATGVITGTPNAVVGTTTYTVTGTNTGGSATALVVITVNDPPPGVLTYSANPATYTKGQAIQPNIPSNTGGAIATYSVAPALPLGLFLNSSSGVISGTPTALVPISTYTVTGTGSTGATTTATLTLTIRDVPPSISYGSNRFTLTTGVPIVLNPSNSGGPVVTWTLSPALPVGLSFNTSSGSVTGTPTSITPAATYMITGTNTGGTSSVSPTLEVTPPAPVITAQPGNLAVYRGQAASFSVTATGTGTLSYQWRKNATDIPGATAKTLSLPSVLLTDNGGAFSVVVSDPYNGSTTSSSAVLTVMSGFTLTGNLLTPRTHHGAALLPSGKVLIVGGFEHTNGDRLKTAEIYDPITGAFTPTGAMAQARSQFTVTRLMDGKVLVVGGQPFTSPISAEVYDEVSGTFTATGRLNFDRLGHTATLLSNGKVLIAGGDSGSWGIPGTLISRAELYDPTTGQFTLTGSMIAGRVEAESILLPNGKVLVSGGMDMEQNLRPYADIYNPATGTWSPSTTTQLPRYGHQMALLSNGKVLVAGGQGHQSISVMVTQVFDPYTGAFSDSGTLNLRSSWSRLCILPNGKPLRTGGITGNFANDKRSDLYNPATGTWSLDAPINLFRMNHSVTTLPDGRTLIVGGSHPFGDPVPAAAEIYE